MDSEKLLLQILNNMKEGFAKIEARVTNLENNTESEFSKVQKQLDKLNRNVESTIVQIFNMLKEAEKQNNREIEIIKEKHKVISQVLAS